MKFSTLNLLLSLTAIAISLWALLSPKQTPQLAYVRSNDLLADYAGTKEAYQKYEVKAKNWQKHLDSLQGRFQVKLTHYQKRQNNLSPDSLKHYQKILQAQEQEIRKYNDQITRQKAQEDEQLTTQVYLQIDSYIKEYAKVNGYSIILGAQGQGNVLYAEDALDITEPVLVYINQKYLGK